MERGALIGGVAVVGLLAVFAAVFVMGGVGGVSSEPVAPAAPRTVPSGENPTWEVKPSAPGNPRREGDLPEAPPVIDEDGVVRRPNPEGLGAEKWAEIRAQKNAQLEARARGVIESFVVGMSADDETRFRDIFEHVFTESSAIRAESQADALTPEQQREELAALRAKTIEDLTTLLGGEQFSRLRTELRRADAVWF